MAGASSGERRVLVTGGTGLVGRAIEAHVQEDPVAGETWHFISSKDGDMRCGRGVVWCDADMALRCVVWR